MKAMDPVSGNPVHIHLHKVVPMGAGLGGGSADGAAVLTLMNEVLNLDHSISAMEAMAAKLGSDCPFFIGRRPQYVTGRGEHLEEIDIDLSDKHIVVVHPGVHVSTAEAYRIAEKGDPECDLRDAIQRPIQEWQGVIRNGFETPMIDAYPVIGEIRDKLISDGAQYVSMTGSGSAVYGIFESRQKVEGWQESCSVWAGTLSI